MDNRLDLFGCISASTTKSLCLVVSSIPPYPISVIEGPGLNPLEFSIDDFFYNIKKNVYKVIEEFRDTVKIKDLQFRINKLSLSMEGLHFASDIDYVKNALKEFPISPENDEDILIIDRGMACILSQHIDCIGSLIKVGTSAFTYFCNPIQNNLNVKKKKIGGWGIFTGYDGGGYDVGRCLIYRIFDELEGRKENTSFFDKVSILLNIDELSDLTNYIRKSATTGSLRKNISALSNAVVELAENDNDKVSKGILKTASKTIIENFDLLLSDVAEKRDILRKPIIISGGLITSSAYLCDTVISELGNKYPTATFELLRSKGILGNLIFALDSFGLPRDMLVEIINQLLVKESRLAQNYNSKILDLFKK